MNSSSASVNASALQTPQIIRINYPRPLIDRKPDDEPTRIVISSAQSSASATVPQIVSILNPTIANVITTAPSGANGGTVNSAKKCTFHRQCLHVQSPQSQQHHQQQQLQQQQQTVSQLIHQHQIQLPSPQLLHHHPQLLQQQQQIRISSTQIPPPSGSSTVSAVNRASAQANRDAISTNITPQLNAALLQDRYLLLDLVDGSSFYKCIDIHTQKMLVCKVRPCRVVFLFPCSFVLVPKTCFPRFSLSLIALSTVTRGVFKDRPGG